MNDMVIRESGETVNEILTEPQILAKGRLQKWQIECLLSKALVRILATSRQI